MLPTRRIRGALVIWLAPRVEQHLLGRIACEPTKNFFDLALLFQPLKQIVDIGVLQRLARAPPVHLDEHVIGLYFLSVNDDEVIQEVIDQFT